MKRTRRRELRFAGHPVSPGIGIGPFAKAEEPALAAHTAKVKIAASDIAGESARLEEAIARSRRQLGKLKSRLSTFPEESRTEIEPLLDAYLHMLGASRLTRGIRKRIADNLHSAETAVAEESEAQALTVLGGPGADRAGRQRRAEEVREIGRRLLRNLTRQPFRSFSALPAGAVLGADQLRPADAALIEPSRFAGVVTGEGGAEGHTAVMLRALNIPAVLGAEGLMEAAAAGDSVIVDGEAGLVVLNPTEATLAEARQKLAAHTRAQTGLARLRRLAAVTTDKVAITLQANLELAFELPLVAQSGAHGIGLMRTEFLFMNRETLPDEDDQLAIYRPVVEAMDGEPVTIRVLDWGSEKEVEALAAAGMVADAPEQNPALGMRGIRLLLENELVLETQLAAILRASAFGPVRVLLPMVGTVDEIRETRAIAERVWRRLKRRGARLPESAPPIGIMVETPAAALKAATLAREADFFALGTNDLTMYTLAADRGLPAGTGLYDPLDPALLRLIHETARAGLAAGIAVSVCGELAGRAEAAPLLLGLGIRQLSMHGHAIPRVKRAVRASTQAANVALAAAALAAESATAVRALLAPRPEPEPA